MVTHRLPTTTSETKHPPSGTHGPMVRGAWALVIGNRRLRAREPLSPLCPLPARRDGFFGTPFWIRIGHGEFGDVKVVFEMRETYRA
jgi:hypothetical protein